jgi:hypothetical protein
MNPVKKGQGSHILAKDHLFAEHLQTVSWRVPGAGLKTQFLFWARIASHHGFEIEE